MKRFRASDTGLAADGYLTLWDDHEAQPDDRHVLVVPLPPWLGRWMQRLGVAAPRRPVKDLQRHGTRA